MKHPGPYSATSTAETPPLATRALEPSPPPWQSGTHFSRYEIDSKLATGGMAEVWRARLKGVRGFEKRIVLKTMLSHLASRPDIVDMFINEATVASAFSHPNIVHVFDFGQLEGRYFIAMEFVPGVTLRFAHKRMLARNERLPVAATLHVMADVCQALHAVHELADANGPLGLVHRDLSPDNVILSTSGAAKLIDFGAARATTRTATPRTFVGKYRYAAPERIRRGAEDRRADVYSAGVILYECLTGVRPFEGSDTDVADAMRIGRICDPRERVPELPPTLAEAVIRATSPDRTDRFATARELSEALGRCLAEMGAAGKERDVTASLAALIEGPPEPLPVVIATERTAEIGRRATESSTTGEVALCEVEIIEASGPIQTAALRLPPEPPTVPTLPGRADPAALSLTPPPRPPEPSAPHWSVPGQLFDRAGTLGGWGPHPLPGPPATTPLGKAQLGQRDRVFGGPGPGVVGWRRTPETPPPDGQQEPVQKAVELFDKGIELRAAGRYGEALQAWERALALAPENLVYRANVLRLRDQLSELRRAQRRIERWD